MNRNEADDSVLRMKGICMRFGEVSVLQNVSFAVRRGSIHAVVGHNGAGKSTLMKIALGAQVPSEGEVLIGGQRLTYSRPAEARSLGLGMVMQERSLIHTLSGLDNLFLNSERLNRAGCIDMGAERREVLKLVEELGITPALLSTLASDMSTIEQELIEIARALRLGDKLLVLDEPTAPLGREEINKLFAVMRRIATRGTGIVLITHHLAEVFAISDEVTCLREGKVVLSCPTRQTNLDRLIAAMLGRQSWDSGGKGMRKGARRSVAAAAEHGGARPSLTVRNLRVGAKLAEVSFDAYPGEVLGVVGLAGSGRTTLLRVLFGDLPTSSGEIALMGTPYRPRSPQDAISQGVFLIPEDRGIHGLMLTKPIAENVILVVLRRLLNALGLLNISRGRSETRQMMRTLLVRASSEDQIVGELSGGNQQKVVLAKALTLGADLLLLDEPTFGVDIEASREIAAQVRSMAENGTTVLWASSDLLEIISVADRVLIIRDGVAGAALKRDEIGELSEDRLVAMMQREQFHQAAGRQEASHAAH